ncbi:hypothetical protein ETB97_008784 [Aspergillus alliaceus]|uniref:Uncharacterized protein n=1 Tax=Petromyces alliaceus TaxID=209559 RepID=A0A8H6E935_PETAA|nr:hypothetical protein ETB97_008784 [Aspergillus burnettii]
MAVDQVLSTEVVFPNERFVTASFTENTELFWALRGGGGSIFGVVTSVTIKAYPTIPATTSTFTWTTGPKSNITHGRFWAGIRAYLDLFIEHSDAGIYSYLFILPSKGEYTFLMQPFFAPNKTIPEIQALLNPWFQRLHQLGITFTPKTQYLDNFYSAWDASFPLEVVEKAHVVTGSRLFPKSNWEDPSRLNATFDAIRASSEAGLTLIASNMAPTLSRAGNPDNAVNPAWRRTVMHALSSVNWSPDATAQEITAARHNFTYGHMQRWRVVTEHGLPTENAAPPLAVKWYVAVAQYQLPDRDRAPSKHAKSRKIKCNLPNADELGPLGSSQSPEKSCERCRSLNLECIVERATLGRPSLKRERLQRATPLSPNSRKDDDSPSIIPLEIKDYLATEAIDDLGTTKALGEQRLFQTTVEFQYFFASVLAKDRIFGATIPTSTSGWTTPLPELVSHEMATALDNELVWHRFFLPNLPSLVSIRNRLELDGPDFASSATNLLFALLCLIALDTTDKFVPQHPRLKWTIQLSISSYGQEFIFSPPTHRDSVVVCLLLAYYRPTAVVSSQHTAHKAIKSTLYLGIAFKIAERLEILPSQLNLFVGDITTMNNTEFEHQIADSLQGLEILSQDLLLDGLLSKPVHSLQTVLDRMAPHIQAYRHVVKHRSCSPRVIFQIQWATSSYMLLEALKATKQGWGSPEKLYRLVEEIEEKCLRQIQFCDWALTQTGPSGAPEEISAARSLLEQRFHAIIVRIYGISLLYILVLKSRTPDCSLQGDPEIYPHETVQMGAHVSNALNNISDKTSELLFAFLSRFGKIFPDRLLAVLEMFIKCTDLKLGGVPFQAPFRDMVLDIIIFSRAIVENNSIHVKNLDGKMRENSDYQMEVMGKCAKRLEKMVASPGKSIEAAFAGGCVYAASTKVMMAFLDIIRNLKKKSKCNAGQILSIMSVTSTEGLAMGMPENSSPESRDLWPNGAVLNPSDAEGFIFDWSSIMNFDGVTFDGDTNLDLNPGSC